MNLKEKKRVIAYIDGFNVYHSLRELKNPALKWLNLWSLTESITRGDENLNAVKYFSAFATWKPEAYKYHRHYVQALNHFGVEDIMGNFKKKDKKCPKCNGKWTDHEEKETDVNIALKILCDAIEDKFDRAIIMSADSDLIPVIKEVKSRFPNKEIFVAVLGDRYDQAHDIRNQTGTMRLNKGRIKSNLLPDKINLSNGYGIIYNPYK